MDSFGPLVEPIMSVVYKMVSIIENGKYAAPLEELSKIQQYFAGSTVFITGGTGFLGKLIIEKLLRTCTDIKKVYVLIRTKKGKSEEKRFEEILANVLFDRLKGEQPKFAEKITLMTGDCIFPNFGLKEEDRQKLIKEVNCIFHCAATVRFDEKLRTAAYINVRATKDILVLAKEMKQLKSFVYVSTAYSNCVNKDIKEEFYNPPITEENLLSLVDFLDEDLLANITPTLIGKWPNTYAFSKAVAEGVIKSEGKELPIAVVRPSIVISTVKEPIAGWIDNVYGPTGVLVGGSLGLIRTMHTNLDCLADVVPADFVINCTIAAAWDVGTKTSVQKTGLEFDNSMQLRSSDCKKGIPGKVMEIEKMEDSSSIYNYISSTQKPITWRNFMSYSEKHGIHTPSPLMVWYPFAVICSSYFMYTICAFFLHQIPAYIVDCLAYCLGKQPILVKGYQKIDKFLHVLSYFGINQWNFRNDNTQSLWRKLNLADQKSFDFNMGGLDWDTYFHTYIRGGRVYLLKDPLDTIPQGRAKYLKLKVVHYVVVGLLILGLYKLLMNLVKAFL